MRATTTIDDGTLSKGVNVIKFNCDICGKETFINPPTEQVFVEQEFEYDVPDQENPSKLKKEKKLVKVPEMTVMRMQHPNDPNQVLEQKIPKLKDLKPRMWRVQLRVGQESVDRDFCKECLDKEFKSDLACLRDKLESIERK